MAVAPDESTIDELAQRTGTPTSTIRLYQAKGLLPGPRREGRVGYYGPQHLMRLRLISQLQADGFSLAGISRLLDAWRQGRGLDEVLGLEAQVAATWGTPEPLVLTPGELAARLPGGNLPVELARRAFELGLLRFEGDTIIIDDPTTLDVGTQLAELGVPLSETLDEFQVLKELMDQVAARFTLLFRERVWSTFVERGLPEGQVPDVLISLQHLSRLAEVIVASSLRSSLRRAADRFLAEQSEVLEAHGLAETIKPLARAAGLEAPDAPDEL
ncbi:MAG TPA: MerR family transcriptional regulator [Acidimicrobiales bacterium]|nr:MerR family transcriptional regulator [Acidimicrobiales bacterium]